MGARFSSPVQIGPGAHPASCTMGTGFFLGVKGGRGVTLTPNPLLVPWSRKGRAIPLLPLWAVRPVQSFSACTRVHVTFTTISIQPVLLLVKSNEENKNTKGACVLRPHRVPSHFVSFYPLTREFPTAFPCVKKSFSNV